MIAFCILLILAVWLMATNNRRTSGKQIRHDIPESKNPKPTYPRPNPPPAPPKPRW